MYHCAKCVQKGCEENNLEKTLPVCPSKNKSIKEGVMSLYQEEENYKIAHNAALVEAEGYCSKTRVEEIIMFLKKCNYHKIGLAFCCGLQKEAREFENILTYHGFEVVSVICKNGAIPKSFVGIQEHEKIQDVFDEIMCNPIGQAKFLNEQHTEFNVILGLCVGHDTLAIKYMDAPVTILAVKDRVTGHNPLAAIYNAQGYYKNKLYPEFSKDDENK